MHVFSTEYCVAIKNDGKDQYILYEAHLHSLMEEENAASKDNVYHDTI